MTPDTAPGEQAADRLRVLLLHGPNLDQLGDRDPAHYGSCNLDDLVAIASRAATREGAELVHEQQTGEADLVRRVHAVREDGTAAVVVNPGALTHYSYALRDALELLAVPKIEVHLSNVHARERFRRRSVVAAACDGSIAGLGADGYDLAVTAAVRLARARAGRGDGGVR